MIDIGLSKMALIGVVALVVVGPERLPRVARTIGALLGKAQRYVADVKAEVNRSMELEELRRAKATMEDAARDVQHSVEGAQRQLNDSTRALSAELQDGLDWSTANGFDSAADGVAASTVAPVYRHPGKKFRLRRTRVPQWYKLQTGQRTHVQSGAARVARLRPRRR